ncbi:3-dehydroquinate synthase [Ekhidna sp.]
MSNNLPTYLTISSDIQADLEEAIMAIQPDKIAILVDENTRTHCLSKINYIPDILIEIKSGESEKNLSTCQHLWNELTESGFTRKSLLINLGGGVIGDMGGFVAATFKRGMAFINIPTTLLSQVDASIGGKLGVDFNGLKNHIGIFQEPHAVIVYPNFLETLPERELKSGFAEVIKHALIKDESQWEYLTKHSFDQKNWHEIIPRSIAIKNEIVNEDPREQGLRKILNYGHTVGHAIESYLLETSDALLHGEAVALGMILENEIAVRKNLLDKDSAAEIREYIDSIYQLSISIPSYNVLENLLIQDKKNDQGGIRFSLIEKVGTCVYDELVDSSVLKEVLK